jgi:putative ABC transport system permease protein
MPADSPVGGFMMTFLKFAIRNIFRNKRRTLLTAVSIFIASIIVAFSLGYINGLVDNILVNYQNYMTGNMKVTTIEYAKLEKFMPVDEYLAESGKLAGKIGSIRGVGLVEQRVRFGIIMGKGDQSETAVGIGVDLNSPKLELKQKIIEGKLEGEGLYIGKGLAEKLQVKLGDDMLLATKTSEGGLNGIKKKVKGILSFGIGMMDKGFFFIDLPSARKLLKLSDMITEIYVFTDKKTRDSAVNSDIRKILPAGAVIRDPSEQVGPMYNLMAAAKYIYYFMDMLIVFLASFVVINTMMMAVFERMQEIGTLKAMGMTDRELFINFILEGAAIGSLGAVPGAIIGYLIVAYYSVKGMDFSSISNMALPFNYVVHPVLDPSVLALTILIAVVITAISSIIPAKRAQSLTPAEALRKI